MHIFHVIAWLFSTGFPDHGEDGFHVMRCVRRYGDSGPMSLPYYFDSLGQLKNWLRVQGVSIKALMFWATGSPLLYLDPPAGFFESSEFS